MALALTLYYHLGVPGAVVTFLLGLPGLYLGWVALQDARRPQDRSLAQIADELAARLRSQWADEAEARGLNDPYPLPVAWTAANVPLAGDLDALKKLATSGAGWLAQGRDNWAKGPEDLAGGGDRKLADVLAAVPTGRLVVLGGPGTGKTMLMVGLVLDLLHPGRRSSGGPVPVLATLASWDPVSQDMHGWLGATLITAYPDLAAAAPPGSPGGNRFEALLAAGLILPVLDGLDEIPEAARPTAITRINKELKPGEQVVVTCRTDHYRAAVNPQHGQGAALRAAAVQLSTLEFGEVASYLREDAGPAENRWDFLDRLGAESPVRQALATPLMAGLARAIYNPGERAGDSRDPAKELCKSGLADRAAVEAHLFDEFIPAVYQLPTGGRWTAERAEAWLVFLARHLEQTIGRPDLAWWQLRQAAPRSVAWLGSARAPARGVRISISGLAAGFVAGLVLFAAGFVGGLVLFAAGLGLGGWLRAGLLSGLAFGSVTVYAFGLQAGLMGVPRDLTGVTNPRAVLARDRRVALLFMLGPGLGAGLAFGLWGGFASGLALGLIRGLGAGLGFGLGAGVVITSRTAWPSYVLTRGWLAFHHHLPWSLMSFLADAHRRGVLRQAGAVYQFRHIDLQRRLATRRDQGQIAARISRHLLGSGPHFGLLREFCDGLPRVKDHALAEQREVWARTIDR